MSVSLLRPRLPVVARGLFILLLFLPLSACLSVIGDPTRPSQSQDDTAVSESPRDPARDHFFDTPEDSVMDTPWFTVSSVILQVQRTQPETVIVVPADSNMRRYLSLNPLTETPRTTIPGNRFLFNLGIMTDGVPPFTSDPDRYQYPELYE
ncbi:MAG: hypothetical protein R6U25_04140 [Alkalispirochaeta sp.]